MKKRTTTLLALSITIFFPAVAQNSDINIPEPQYIGRMLYVSGDEGIPLEQQKASTKAKAGASMFVVGVGKVTGTNEVKGAASPVRVEASEKLQFIIRVPDNNMDPFQLINIFRLEPKIKSNADKSVRVIETSSAATFSGSSAMDINMIEFESRKYGESSILITVASALVPGEYAMTLQGSRDLFNMFGVD